MSIVVETFEMDPPFAYTRATVTTQAEANAAIRKSAESGRLVRIRRLGRDNPCEADLDERRGIRHASVQRRSSR